MIGDIPGSAIAAGTNVPAEEVLGEGASVSAVDVLFELSGTQVPADYAAALALAVTAALPWFEGEARAGIHPLRAAPSTHGTLVLARRARLMVRVPDARAAEALALTGRRLDLRGEPVTVGAGHVKALAPSATLYAQRVATGARDERAFHDDVVRWLADLGVRCGFISGRARSVGAGDSEVMGFSLALHGLGPADSLRVQAEGIGGERRLGFGIFVPHKAIATSA
jgi:CRISPR-associated protein Cas6